MESWLSVLKNILCLAEPLLVLPETQWVIVGSAATALQGADVVPGDIDILAQKPVGVFKFAELMAPYMPQHIAVSPDHDGWRSSKEQPVSEGPDEFGFYWTFARWFVDDVKVEVAHIEGPDAVDVLQSGGGIWEAGPEMWPHICHVSFQGYQVPVVPLEIQLETCLQRGLEKRADAILNVFQREGYEAALLERALRREHLEWFKQQS